MGIRHWARGCALAVPALLVTASITAGAPDATPAGDPARPELDEILVLGEQPGPAMWKVSRGDHTLWIMGTITPMPKRMTWRQRQAEAVIRASGEILGDSDSALDMDLGIRQSFGMLRQLLRLRHNADGSTLREVLPPDVYARWHAAHRRWFGKDPSPRERARPLYASILLHQRAVERSGLTEEPVVWKTAERIARDQGVRVRQREFRIKVEDPRGMLDELARLPREKETACLVEVMDFIDSELPQMKLRAEAWAKGDLSALRTLPEVGEEPACMALGEGTQLAQLVETEEALFEEDWSGIVDWLLLAHETSFTTLPVGKLLDPEGVLAQLRRKGYTVDEPAGAARDAATASR
jgi:uncharacterized protein YbaP (TraB family)